MLRGWHQASSLGSQSHAAAERLTPKGRGQTLTSSLPYCPPSPPASKLRISYCEQSQSQVRQGRRPGLFRLFMPVEADFSLHGLIVAVMARPQTLPSISTYGWSCNGLPWWLGGQQSPCWCGRLEFDPWVGKIPRRREWQPTPVFLPGKFHGWTSLVGYSPRMPKSQTWISYCTTTGELQY